MIARIRKELEALGDRPVQWRRWMHQHPELAFHEEATAAYVASVLKAEGLIVREGLARHPDRPAGTGLIALVTGSRSPSDRCFALRADMDALPIQEVGKDGYRSLNPGVMHACGHDAHTAMVLAAGLALHRMREAWSGTLMPAFQPAADTEPGGASLFAMEGAITVPTPPGVPAQYVTPELDSV